MKSTGEGPDGIPPRLLKLAPDEFAAIIFPIFNHCLQQSVTPSLWKEAIVTPVFKKDDKTKISNYRPISITSPVPKIFEHIMISNISTFIYSHNIISNKQFGFRTGSSTEHALLDL
jgi:hypothetical protein